MTILSKFVTILYLFIKVLLYAVICPKKTASPKTFAFLLDRASLILASQTPIQIQLKVTKLCFFDISDTFQGCFLSLGLVLNSSQIYLFSFMCMCAFPTCMCVHHMHACIGLLGLELWIVNHHMSAGPLKEYQVLLTSEVTLQLFFGYFKIYYCCLA